MSKSLRRGALVALGLAGLGLTPATEARQGYSGPRPHPGKGAAHGLCLRFNKTTGAMIGAIAGGVLGRIMIGGTSGMLAGVTAGGVAGHELAHDAPKKC